MPQDNRLLFILWIFICGSVLSFSQNADMELTLAVSDLTPNEGQTIEFKYTVKNLGPSTATNIIVEDLIPAGFTYVSDDGSGWYNSATDILNIPSLNSGSSYQIKVNAYPNTGTNGTTITASGNVTGLDQTDPENSNNTVSESIIVNFPDLELTKVVDDSTPDEGQIVQFTLEVINNGPMDATSIIVNDLLPAGLTYVSDDSGGTYNNVTGIWTVGNLDDGDKIEINIDATVNTGTAAQTITNTASITSFDQLDNNPADNTSSVDLFVNGADLIITKTVSDENPAVNDIITYTILVENNGPLKANNITIQDILPTQLNYQSSTITQGNPYNSGTGQWFANDIDAGNSATLTITVQVDPSANNLLVTNTASVLSVVEADSITDNNSDTADIGVGSADLEIQKTVNVATQSEGGTVIFTIQATNNSLTTDAFATFITDLLPEEVTYVSDDSASSGTTYDPVTGEWDVGTVVKNTTKTLNITCTVNSGTGGLVITNTASGTSMMEDPNTANNTNDASFQVIGADLEVTKSVDNAFPTELDLIVYTVTVTNNGPVNANSIVVNDILPFNVTFDSYTASQGTYDFVTGDWNVGALNNGASETLTITAQVRISGAFTNYATVTNSSQSDGVTNNNTGSIRVSAKEIFSDGSAIIDMGVTPQTYNNGLVPYGLVYELAINNNIPIYWVVNHTKSWVNPNAKQDQIDITVNGKDYKGGPFVIPAEFMSVATPIINTWVTNYPGLTVDTGLPEFEAPIYDYISSFPRAVLDDQNGDKVQDAFYDRANVPITFGRLGDPDDLTLCDDMYTMPHADPQNWASSTVDNLIDFIENGGFFWSACHAVSAMEGLVDTDGDGNPDLNLLSNNGLIPWGDHGNGTPAYSYNTDISILNDSETAGDPLMQFMTTMDGALQNGSEQIYIPDVDGWRDTTVLAVTDEDHPEVTDGTYPPGPATALAYGRAFSDDTNGLVMYEGSHSIAGGSEEENTAAARVYGNFLLQAGIERRPKIKIDLIPEYNPNDEDVTFIGEVSGIAPPFTYQWSDNCSGTFNDNTLLNTTYTPDDTVDLQTCLLTLIVTDNCGRKNFTSFPVKFEIDTDDDGYTDTIDLDDDNDGIPDVIEENGDTNRDTDNDGVLDRIDRDADGDGIMDINEGGLTDAQIATYDTNSDGAIDDSFSFGPNGVIDDLEISTESGTVDYDGNGLQDDFRNSESDATYDFQDIDADNDGIPDNVEAQSTFGYIAPAATSNRFGINNAYLTNLVLVDTDFDSIPDYLDTDTDDDGTPDIEENGMANALSGADTDGDGLDNNFEGGNLNDIDVNDEINVPSASILPDTDGDKAIGGDVDFRDIFDTNPPSSATIDFDGIDDYMASNLDISGYTQATFMAWIKLDSSFSTRGTVLDQEYAKVEILSNATIRIQLNSAIITLPISSALNLNEWTHIAFTYNSAIPSDKLKLFVNGNLMATNDHTSLNSAINATTKSFTLGKSLSSTNYFKGCIDEVRVFDLAITEDQLRQTIYQEIESDAGSVGGKIIPKAAKDITTEATIPWNNLQAYYPMTGILSSRTSDYSDNSHTATLYYIKSVQAQTAPMPYESGSDGNWTSSSTWTNGDVWDITDVTNNNDWSIIKINSNVTTSDSHNNLGLIIEPGQSLTLQGDNKIENTLYLELNGTMDLQDDSQLIQGIYSDLVTSANGKLLRRQEGHSSVHRYNYWASPVGSLLATSLTNNNAPSNNDNNTSFSLDMLKDGSGADLQFTNAYDEGGKISTYWLHTFQNGMSYWDWLRIGPSYNIIPGVGYTQKGTGNAGTEQQYTFEGKPNNGTIILPADDVEGDSANESERGVTLTTTLIGNPYPSAIDAQKFIADNTPIVTGTLQLWEQWAGNSHYLADYQGGYGYINSFTTLRAYQHPDISIEDQTQDQGFKTPTFYIPVGQAFFAEVIEDGEIEFNNSQRIFIKENDADGSSENGSAFLRTASENNDDEAPVDDYKNRDFQLIKLEFSTSSGGSRRFVMGFSEKATDSLDHRYDGGLIHEIPDDDMGTLLNDKQYVIQAYSPINSEKVIDLNLNATGNFQYTLKAVEIKNFSDEYEIFLLDNLTNTFHNLREDGEYNFTSEPGQFKERFDVVFRDLSTMINNEVTIEEEELTGNTLVYLNQIEDKLYVKSLDGESAQLTITNILGQIINSYSSLNKNELENGISISNMSSGVYLLKLIDNNNNEINKRIIKN